MVESTTNQEESKTITTEAVEEYTGPVYKEMVILVPTKDELKHGRPFD